MTWQSVDTIPIRVNASVAPARADAIRAALLRRAVPLSRIVDGRLEPLATAGLVADGRRTGLLTAAHIFEGGVCAGDLAIPLPRERDVALLRSARVRVVMHAVSDLAVLWIDDALARRLCANWESCPLPQWQADDSTAATYVVVGYPAENVRRIGGSIYAKPLVLFTAAIDGARFAYARTAERTDGLMIHTPALDGVSGATVWGVTDEREDGVGCLLRPAAIQIAFLHGRHLRAEPMSNAVELLML
jgi:hypothetical protein